MCSWQAQLNSFKGMVNHLVPRPCGVPLVSFPDQRGLLAVMPGNEDMYDGAIQDMLPTGRSEDAYQMVRTETPKAIVLGVPNQISQSFHVQSPH